MAIEQLGTAGLTQEARTTYDRALLERALPNLVHARPEFHRISPIPPRGGRVVNWRRLELVSATTTALTEGTPPADTQITVSAVNATVDQYGQVVKISDVAETQSIDPIVAEVVEMLGEVMGNSRDQVVRNTMTAGTTVQYASTAGSRGAVGSGMDLTFAEIREAVDTLERNDARKFPGGVFHAIIHPDTKRDLFGDSDVIQSFQQGRERGLTNPMFTGEIGQFYGVRFFESSNARIFGSAGLSGADVYATMIFGQEFMGLSEYSAQQARVYVTPRDTPDKTDPLRQYMTVGWKMSLAAARLNENFAVRIEHNTSRKRSA